MDDETRGFLARGVEALERLAQDPVIQMETGPPVCPYCERVNPSIRVQEKETTGAMSEFVIQAHCLHCNEVFYGVPVHWLSVKTVDDVRAVISDRVEMGGYENGN